MGKREEGENINSKLPVLYQCIKKKLKTERLIDKLRIEPVGFTTY